MKPKIPTIWISECGKCHGKEVADGEVPDRYCHQCKVMVPFIEVPFTESIRL